MFLPVNVTSLTISLKHQLREIEFQHCNKYVAETRSKVMTNIFDKAIKVASLDTPILVLGETGVGKDFLVRFMHNVPENSNEHFLIKVNCGAIPGSLLESELFGYEAGAFTDANKQGKVGLFELANSGYLYYASGANTGDAAGPIPAAFPKGYAAFYMMKYDISQGQCANFSGGICLEFINL